MLKAGANFAIIGYQAKGREVLMLKRKITRGEFLKAGFFGILAVLVLPVFRMFSNKSNVSRRDARYYKNLAG